MNENENVTSIWCDCGKKIKPTEPADLYAVERILIRRIRRLALRAVVAGLLAAIAFLTSCTPLGA